MFAEYLAIDNETHVPEVRELTETMAENLSEVATVISLNFLGSQTEVWRNRVRRTEHVSRSALAELKRRAIWRDAHAGLLS